MGEFKDKVALITGAGRGLGRTLAAALAAEGTIIAANDITPINLDQTVRQIAGSGGAIREYVFDVAKRLPVEALVTQVLEDLGRIDILINSAGVYPSASILDMDEWDWQRTQDVNLSGPFYAMQQAGRAMREQGGGVIINFGSIPNLSNDKAAIIASKMGLAGLTREAAREFASYHIRVHMIWIAASEEEQALKELLPGLLPDNTLSGFEQGKPASIEKFVLYLCSQAASDLNGQQFYLPLT